MTADPSRLAVPTPLASTPASPLISATPGFGQSH